MCMWFLFFVGGISTVVKKNLPFVKFEGLVMKFTIALLEE